MDEYNFSVLHVLASLVTIVNFAFSLPRVFGVEFFIPDSTFHTVSIATRIFVVVSLEAALSHAFGYLFMISTSMSFAPNFLLSTIVISSLSSWITIFNVSYFVVSYQKESRDIVLLVLVTYLICCGMACFFAYIFSITADVNNEQSKAETIVRIQAFFFAVIGFFNATF